MLIAFLAGTGAADAQSLLACRSINSDPERLTCYDNLPDAASKQTKATEDPMFAKARAGVARNLKDPASARFEELLRTPDAVCGFVNAKDAMGGYTGQRPFVFVISANRGYVLESGLDMLQTAEAIGAAEKHCVKKP